MEFFVIVDFCKIITSDFCHKRRMIMILNAMHWFKTHLKVLNTLKVPLSSTSKVISVKCFGVWTDLRKSALSHITSSWKIMAISWLVKNLFLRKTSWNDWPIKFFFLALSFFLLPDCLFISKNVSFPTLFKVKGLAIVRIPTANCVASEVKKISEVTPMMTE